MLFKPLLEEEEVEESSCFVCFAPWSHFSSFFLPSPTPALNATTERQRKKTGSSQKGRRKRRQKGRRWRISRFVGQKQQLSSLFFFFFVAVDSYESYPTRGLYVNRPSPDRFREEASQRKSHRVMKPFFLLHFLCFFLLCTVYEHDGYV